MEFTYSAYLNMLRLLRENGYVFTDYVSCDLQQKCVILRHDIDYSLEKSLQLAKLEASEGISSTYFVMVTSEFYNVLAKDNVDKLREIQSLGHDIGLHFDEVNYNDCGKSFSIETKIHEESKVLEMILGRPISAVSMHRPSKKTLEADYHFDTIINSYGRKFFKDFKYVSDSRRRWREDVEGIIKSNEYDKLHILTHAFWYNEKEMDIKSSIKEFVKSGNSDRYNILNSNITELESIMKVEEI